MFYFLNNSRYLNHSNDLFSENQISNKIENCLFDCLGLEKKMFFYAFPTDPNL